MEKIKGQFRQGDVLLQSTDLRVPVDAKDIKHDDTRIALAYGEKSNHAHSVLAKDAELKEFDGERVLIIKRLTQLMHGTPGAEKNTFDHYSVPLKKSNKQVIQQTEYSPAELRNVAD